MKVIRGEVLTARASSQWFTGDVYVDSIAVEGSGMNAAVVHFTPGARTAWHRHALGQTIYIVEGEGRVQREGGTVERVRAGDVVFFEPDENHWHGAAPNRFMAHIAMLRLPESGAGTEWGALVTDEEYLRAPT